MRGGPGIRRAWFGRGWDVTYKILLIDGDAARAAKRRAPLVDAGHEVAVATRADDAIVAFDRSKPHLVVIDAAEREDAIRDLCGLLKKKAADVPIALLTDVVGDPRQVALLMNQYGCDQLIDGSLAPERMLRLIEQLVAGGAKGLAPRPQQASGDSGGTTLWLDSEELVNALEKLDTIITHKAAGQVQAPESGASRLAGSAAEILAHVDSRLDRDVPARASNEEVDGGADIDEHLDSVFARGRTASSGEPARKQPVPPPVTAARPADENPPRQTAPRAPFVVKTPQAARQPAAPASTTSTVSLTRTPSSTVAMPVPRPAPAATTEPASSPTAPASQPRPDASVNVALHAPASTVRWLIAATVVVTLLGAGYLLLFRGGEDAGTATMAESGPGPAEAPPFTPAADRAADATDDVRNAGASVPVSAPATRPPAPAPSATPTPMPSSRPISTAPTKPAAAPAAAKPRTVPPAPVSPAAPEKPKVKKTTPREATPAAPTPVARIEEPSAAGQPVVRAPDPTPIIIASAPTAAEPKTEKPPAEPPQQPALSPAPPTPSPAPAVAKTEPGPLVAPTLVKRVEPSYSPKALKGVADPRVVLRVLVDDQGRITRVVVDKGIPGSELEAAAVSAVLRWKFDPARRDGAPVEAWTNAEFKFAP